MTQDEIKKIANEAACEAETLAEEKGLIRKTPENVRFAKTWGKIDRDGQGTVSIDFVLEWWERWNPKTERWGAGVTKTCPRIRTADPEQLRKDIVSALSEKIPQWWQEYQREEALHHSRCHSDSCSL